MLSVLVPGLLCGLLAWTDASAENSIAAPAVAPVAAPAMPNFAAPNLSTPRLASLPSGTGSHREPGKPTVATAAVITPHPFTLEYLLHWLFDHLPKLFTILVASFGLHMLLKVGCRQIAQIMSRSGSRGTQRERENRAVTLVAVFRNVAAVAIIGGGILMALDEVGIPIMPLMGGAAELGLAVAFGAQNLVRDYFSGFMVLMEDQYGINDVVKIGDTSGVVEKITLRVTVLRDLEGIMHFIPHGSITRVSNMTHGWSRAVLEINISYKEDPDFVMGVLLDVAKELRNDPVFRPLILDEPEMLGLDRFGDYSVVIKFVLKTHPLKRWPVKRELLRRIKLKFDELGIEIPYPQHAVYNRQESDLPNHGVEKHRPTMFGKSA